MNQLGKPRSNIEKSLDIPISAQLMVVYHVNIPLHDLAECFGHLATLKKQTSKQTWLLKQGFPFSLTPKPPEKNTNKIMENKFASFVWGHSRPQQVFLLFPLPSRPSCVWKLEVVPMSIVDSIRVLLQMISEHRRYYTKMIFQSSPNVEKLLWTTHRQSLEGNNQHVFFQKEKGKLVGGFNPSEKYLSKWESSPNGGENKQYLKPPPRVNLGIEIPFVGLLNVEDPHAPGRDFWVTWPWVYVGKYSVCQVGRTKCKDLSKLQGIQGCVPAKNLEKPYTSCQNQREFRRWHVSSHTRYFCMAQGQRGSRV